MMNKLAWQLKLTTECEELLSGVYIWSQASNKDGHLHRSLNVELKDGSSVLMSAIVLKQIIGNTLKGVLYLPKIRNFCS